MTGVIDRYEIKGGQEVRDKLRQLDAIGRQSTLTAAATAGAWPIQNQAKINAHKVTGNLARSIHNEVVDASDSQATVAVGTNAIYARMEEIGGVIVPVRAKRLAWKGIDGRWHFARRVVRKGHPYMRPAFDTQKHRAEAEAIAVILKLAGLK